MGSQGSRVVVVGGGIAGICAALALAERGVPVLLLEKDEISFGGRAASKPGTRFEHAGRTWDFTLEHGMHGWWRQYKNFLGIVDRYDLRERLVDAEDQAVIFCDGKNVFKTNVGKETQITSVPEPLHHVKLLAKKNIRRMIGFSEIPRIGILAARVLEAIRFDPYDEVRKAEYDRTPVSDFTRGMPLFFQAFLRSLCRSGFFSDPQEVSLWAFMLALQYYVFLRRDDQRFEFTRGPIVQSLFEPLLERVRQLGGQTEKGIEVERLERSSSGGWRIRWKRNGIPASGTAMPDAGGELYAPEVVLAVDVAAARRLQEGSPHLAGVYGDISVFRGRPSTVIRTWWTQRPSLDWAESGVFSGRAVIDCFFWLDRFQPEFSAWHDATGGAVSEAHIYAPLNLHELPDDELIRRVENDFESAYPEIQGSAVHRTVVRNAATHINFPVGCGTSFPKVKTCFRDMVLCGDWIDGGLPVLYSERACQTGLTAANELLAARGLQLHEILRPAPPPTHMRALQGVLRVGRGEGGA
jgi:isorenieratene synthase